MVDRYLSVKFGVNALDSFRENGVYGRTDGCPRDDSSSAVQEHKAELKIRHKKVPYMYRS